MKTIYQIKKALIRRLWFFKKISFYNFGVKSLIYKPICIINKKNINIGKHVSIGEFARIEGVSNWNNTKYNPYLEIGDRCNFEQYVHITFASKLTIGANCTFLSRCMVTTIEHEYTDISKPICDQKIKTMDTQIGKNCFFCMDVKIFPGVKIGDNVIVGANSIVMNDLPSYTVCVGTPAQPIKRYNFETKIWEKL